MAERDIKAVEKQIRLSLTGSMLRRKMLRTPQLGAWPRDSEIDPERNLAGSVATLNHRLQALFLELGLRPSGDGWRSLALMLLAEHPEFRAFRRPQSPPKSRERSADGQAVPTVGPIDERPLPPERLSDESAHEIRLFRRLVESGLTKDEADEVIVHDTNFEAELCAMLDSSEGAPKRRKPGAVKRKALRYESYRMPSRLDSPALKERQLSDAWLRVLLHSAPAADPYLSKIQRLIRSVEAGNLSESDCQAAISKIVSDEIGKGQGWEVFKHPGGATQPERLQHRVAPLSPTEEQVMLARLARSDRGLKQVRRRVRQQLWAKQGPAEGSPGRDTVRKFQKLANSALRRIEAKALRKVRHPSLDWKWKQAPCVVQRPV